MRTEHIIDAVYELVEACDRRDIEAINRVRSELVKAWDNDSAAQTARIAELEREVARLRGALESIARYADVHCPDVAHQAVMVTIQQVVTDALGEEGQP